MNLKADEQADGVVFPELDELVLALDRELAVLHELHYRIAVLRFTLVDGNPRFILEASREVEAVTHHVLEHDPIRRSALEVAARTLSIDDARMSSIIDAAPPTHRTVLRRISNDLDDVSRSLSALRDAVRRLSEDGRRAVLDLLDLTQPADSDHADPTDGHIFIGEI